MQAHTYTCIRAPSCTTHAYKTNKLTNQPTNQQTNKQTHTHTDTETVSHFTSAVPNFFVALGREVLDAFVAIGSCSIHVNGFPAYL